MELLNELAADHWAIRDFLKTLRSEGSDPKQKQDCLRSLGRWLKAHRQGEEKTINEHGKRQAEMRVIAYEDGEEHSAIEILFSKLEKTRNPYLWQARLHLLCEMIDHHLDEEEEEYFPLLKRELSKEQNEHLARKYRGLMKDIESARPPHPGGILGWISGRPEPEPLSDLDKQI
jgi:hemerythrin superfamily protein